MPSIWPGMTRSRLCAATAVAAVRARRGENWKRILIEGLEGGLSSWDE